MIPNWWQFLLLSLLAFRLTRLAGWDDFPPIAATRDWVVGAKWVFIPNNGRLTPAEEIEEGWWEHDRPLLAALFQCAFCLGWWISLAVAAAWWLWPHATVLVSLPFALSSVVGLVAKNLDA